MEVGQHMLLYSLGVLQLLSGEGRHPGDDGLLGQLLQMFSW
jgi:hypothetical protein